MTHAREGTKTVMSISHGSTSTTSKTCHLLPFSGTKKPKQSMPISPVLRQKVGGRFPQYLSLCWKAGRDTKDDAVGLYGKRLFTRDIVELDFDEEEPRLSSPPRPHSCHR